MTEIGFGIAAGLLGIAIFVAVLHVIAGEDPPAMPPDVGRRDSRVRDALFLPVPLRKQQRRPTLTGAPPIYNRPLAVDVLPDNRVLDPPRAVQGVNGEN